jgi:hypothetical protein
VNDRLFERGGADRPSDGIGRAGVESGKARAKIVAAEDFPIESFDRG